MNEEHGSSALFGEGNDNSWSEAFYDYLDDGEVDWDKHLNGDTLTWPTLKFDSDFYSYTNYDSFYDIYNNYYGFYEYYEVNLPSTLDKVHRFVSSYFPIISWILALPNILVIYILNNKRNRRMSMSAYLTTLSVADLIIVTADLRSTELLIPDNISLLYCRLVILTTFGTYMSPWIQSIISVERALSVVKPLKVKIICSLTKARITIVCTSVFACGIIGFEQYNAEYDPGTPWSPAACIARREVESFYYYYVLFLSFLTLFLPLFVTFISSIILVVSLASRNAITTARSAVASKRKITQIVLILNGIFLVCNLPYTIHFLIYLYTSRIKITYYNKTIAGILLIFRSINSATNFYVFFLAGSKFRQETKQLLINIKERALCLCKARHREKV